MNKLDLSKIPQELLHSPRIRGEASPRISPSPRLNPNLSPPLASNTYKYASSPRPSLLPSRAIPQLSLTSAQPNINITQSPRSVQSFQITQNIHFSPPTRYNLTAPTSLQEYQEIDLQHSFISKQSNSPLSPSLASVSSSTSAASSPSFSPSSSLSPSSSPSPSPSPPSSSASFSSPSSYVSYSSPLSSISTHQFATRSSSPSLSASDASLVFTPASSPSPTFSSLPDQLPFYSPTASLPSPSVPRTSPRSISPSPLVSSSLSISHPSPFSSPASSPRLSSSTELYLTPPPSYFYESSPPPPSPSPSPSPSPFSSASLSFEKDVNDNIKEKETCVKSELAKKEVAQNPLQKSSPSIPDLDISELVLQRSTRLGSASVENVLSKGGKRSGDPGRRTVSVVTKEDLQQTKNSQDANSKTLSSSSTTETNPLSIVREARELVMEINDKIEGEKQRQEERQQERQQERQEDINNSFNNTQEEYVPVRRSTMPSPETDNREWKKTNDSKDETRKRAWTRGQLTSSSSPSAHKRGNSYGVRIGNGGTTAEEQIVSLKTKIAVLESRNDDNFKMLDNAKLKLERAANCVNSLVRKSQVSTFNFCFLLHILTLFLGLSIILENGY